MDMWSISMNTLVWMYDKSITATVYGCPSDKEICKLYIIYREMIKNVL